VGCHFQRGQKLARNLFLPLFTLLVRQNFPRSPTCLNGRKHPLATMETINGTCCNIGERRGEGAWPWANDNLGTDQKRAAGDHQDRKADVDQDRVDPRADQSRRLSGGHAS
jgi:hypothetical protein